MQHDEEEPAPAELVEFGGEERPPSRWSAMLDRLLSFLTTQKAIAIGAAVILGAVVLSTVVATSGDGGDGGASAAAELPPTSPAPVRFAPGADEARTAPETTWVGYRGVMLAVPSAWVQSAGGCATAPAGWVGYPGSPPGDCPASAARDASTVTFHDDVGGLDVLRRDATVVGSINGRPLSAAPMEQTEGGLLQYLLAPGADSYVVIRPTCDDTTRAIASSARPLPDDRVRVPELRGLPPLEAIQTIRGLGLTAVVGHNSGEALPRDTEVIDQSPIRGVVLKMGAEVTIAVRPAR